MFLPLLRISLRNVSFLSLFFKLCHREADSNFLVALDRMLRYMLNLLLSLYSVSEIDQRKLSSHEAISYRTRDSRAAFFGSRDRPLKTVVNDV